MPRVAQKKLGVAPSSNSARPLKSDRISDEKLIETLRTMPRSTAGQVHGALWADRGLDVPIQVLRDQLRALHEAGVVDCHEVPARRGQPRHYRWWVL